ncbi:hypothetical protein BH10BAC6_BH10BAC6_16280 [soil metagenome]
MSRIILSLTLCVCVLTCARAQDATNAATPPPSSSSNSVAKWSLGVKAGVGGALYAGDEGNAKGGFTWNVGLVYQFSGETLFALGFQPELLIMQEVLRYEYPTGQLTPQTDTRFTHVRIPLNLKLALGSKNVIQPGVMAGMYADYCFSGTTLSNNTSASIGNLSGFGYGAVLGVDVRLLRYLCVDVKYYHALSNLLTNDPMNTRINSLLASVTILF